MRRNSRKIRTIKNHTATAVESVAFGAAAAFLVLFIPLDYFLRRVVAENIWGELIRAVSDAFLFSLVFISVKFLAGKWFLLKNKKYRIEGVWYHVHLPKARLQNDDFEFDYSRPHLSAGTTRIRRELKDFTFVGENYKCAADGDRVVLLDTEPMTVWETETSEIADSNFVDILEVYKSESQNQASVTISECPCCHTEFEKKIVRREAEKSRYGIHKYCINMGKKGVESIRCEYSDCWPSLKSGTLYLYRTEAERDQKICEYFAEQAQQSKVKTVGSV